MSHPAQEPSPAAGSGLHALAVNRLTRALGPSAGPSCTQEVLAHLGLTHVKTPADLLCFANQLLKRGGIIELVGLSLKLTALLRGARER